MNRDLGIDFHNSKDEESKEQFSWKQRKQYKLLIQETDWRKPKPSAENTEEVNETLKAENSKDIS